MSSENSTAPMVAYHDGNRMECKMRESPGGAHANRTAVALEPGSLGIGGCLCRAPDRQGYDLLRRFEAMR